MSQRVSAGAISLCLAIALAAASPADAQQFRGVWVSTSQAGFRSRDEVDLMISRLVQGRYNVLLMQAMAYLDSNGTSSHGANWKSNLAPRSTNVTADFDPLAYVIERAHASGIEVDAWLVPYRIGSAWPLNGNTAIPASGQWLMVPYASRGSVAKFDGTNYWLDPGSPDVQEYVISIARELVTNYEIDGIQWDYEIGSTGKNNWYYADAGYPNSGCARFKRIYGYSADPATTDANWADFRRRVVTELHARCKAEIDAIANPRQPLRHTSCTMAYDPLPACTTSGYQGSAAYTYYGDYATWLARGYIDAAVPMVYRCTSSFEGWVDYFRSCYSFPAKCPRHIYIGQGNYRNSPQSVSLAQMHYVYNAGLPGVCNFNYWYTLGDGTCNTGSNDPSWWSCMHDNIYVGAATAPEMPWRIPASATEGTLWGRVTRQGIPVDNARVSIPGFTAVRSDGNGYYVYTMLPATAAGTHYEVTASEGSDTSMAHGVTVLAGSLRREDISLGETHRAIASWASVRDHGGSEQSIFISSSSGENTLHEPREGGIRKLRVAFDGPITLADPAAVTITQDANAYPAAVALPAGSPEVMEITPVALPDAGCFALTIGAGAILEVLDGPVQCNLLVLQGDTTRNGAVNLGDALYVKSHTGETTDAYPALDVNLSGSIDLLDVLAVKNLITSPAVTATCP